MRLETVKIADPKNKLGYKIINQTDFRPGKDKEFSEKPVRRKTVKKTA